MKTKSTSTKRTHAQTNAATSPAVTPERKPVRSESFQISALRLEDAIESVKSIRGKLHQAAIGLLAAETRSDEDSELHVRGGKAAIVSALTHVDCILEDYLRPERVAMEWEEQHNEKLSDAMVSLLRHGGDVDDLKVIRDSIARCA